MSIESQMEVLGAKLAIEYIPQLLAGSGIPEPITRIVLETMIGALHEQQNTSDEKLRRLVGSYYQSGADYLSDARGLQGERREEWVKSALGQFVTASHVEDTLVAAKSQFFVGVCYDLLYESSLATNWYERAYRSAVQLAAQRQSNPQQLVQLQQFMNTLSKVLLAHGSKISIAQPVTRGNQSSGAMADQKTQIGWLDKANFALKLAGAMTDLESQRYEQALDAFEKLLSWPEAQAPNVAASIFGTKAVALNKLKRYQEALEACEQALRLLPNFAEAYANKSTSLIELQRYEEALAACEQALRLKPNLTAARANKKYILKQLGRNG